MLKSSPKKYLVHNNFKSPILVITNFSLRNLCYDINHSSIDFVSICQKIYIICVIIIYRKQNINIPLDHAILDQRWRLSTILSLNNIINGKTQWVLQIDNKITSVFNLFVEILTGCLIRAWSLNSDATADAENHRTR